MHQFQILRSPAIQLGDQSVIPESEVKRKIQLLRTGTFHHPKYGIFNIRPEHLASMVENFNNKVRGVDIALDYGHNSGGEAAAWFQQLYLSDDGQTLWADVLWTPDGQAAMIKRSYRYISADFTFDYQDNESLQKFGPVLLGAGLTNRPVVKDMAPAIELSEGKGENYMTPEQKKAADDAAAADAAKAAPPVKAADPVAPAVQPPAGAGDDKDKVIADLQSQLEALKAQLANQEVEMGKMKDSASAAEAAKLYSEKTLSFNKLMSDGKVVEAQREAFMAGDALKLAELSQPVNLKAAGSGKEPAAMPNPGADAQTRILTMAKELVESQKIAGKTIVLSEAISQTLNKNPELAKLARG